MDVGVEGCEPLAAAFSSTGGALLVVLLQFRGEDMIFEKFADR